MLGTLPAYAQVVANCNTGTVTGSETYTGTAFVNYGAITNAFSTKNRTTGSLGESFIGPYLGQQNNGVAGFYSRFLLPPTPPVVYASEGDLDDRIQVGWILDPLSPSAELGFNIYRDGAFIAHVEKEVRVYIDFNVQAGRFYNYQISGVNAFGEGSRGSGLGFLNPNGSVTGQVKTLNGNPVADAEITLTPTLGTALSFTGDDQAFAEHSAQFHAAAWSMSCWVKIGAGNNSSLIMDRGSSTNKNWWLHTNGSSKGITFGIGTGTAAVTRSHNFSTDPDGWHHIAVTYSGSSMLLYVDGNLVNTATAVLSQADLTLYMGKAPYNPNAFIGGLDDVRIFRRQLSQTEINAFKNRTVNADANALATYWKFDEGVGTKAYDISANRRVIYLCGPEWSVDRPDVVNGAVTDETGFYKIEGINYGNGTIFTATPSKKVFSNYALEFNNANGYSATLTDSVLLGAVNSKTIELWVQSFETAPDKRAILTNQDLSGGNTKCQISVENGNILLMIGAQELNFGPLGTGYQHLVFSLFDNPGGSDQVTLYKNGTVVSTQNYSNVAENFGLNYWHLGARKTAGGYDQFFSGLIDEVAFYDSTMTQVQAQANFANGVPGGDERLRSWFPLNESRGNTVEDIGPARTGKGTVNGALWSKLTGRSTFVMHEFQPEKQLVTLNVSNTSSDKIDFTDLSTVPVSGYVRFDGTRCYAAGVEILVNGERNSPPIFTDEDGAFIIDLEPGESAILTPKFSNHTFSPASWEVSNVITPIAGILFKDLTKRQIRGQLAGNDVCRKRIIPDGAIVKMKVESLDGCYENEQMLVDTNGKFTFSNLPPIPVTIKLSQHSVGAVFNYFTNKGAEQTDLTDKSDTIDFIYYTPPQIEITAIDFDSTTCLPKQAALNQSDKYSVDIRVYQDYFGDRCYLDSAELTIDNGLGDVAAFDTIMRKGKLRYRFTAGQPNIASPYLKTLSIKADANSLSATQSLQVVVLGKRARLINFTTTTPEIPFVILRDPPGDASNASIEKGKTVCNGWSIGQSAGATASEELAISIGFDTEIATGIGVEKTFQVNVTNTSTFGASATVSSSISAALEACLTTTEVVSTSDGDGIIGADADVYMGGALNLLFGITDDLEFDTTSCMFVRDTGLVVFPEKFKTTFIYTDFQIRNTVIPQLQLLNDTISIKQWEKILALNDSLTKQAVFDKNYSFDAGVVYENAITTETTSSLAWGFGVEIGQTIADELGLEVDGVGLTKTVSLELTVGVETEFSDATTRSQTVGFAFADDDIGDAFTVDVLRDRVYGTPVFRTVSGNSSCPYEPNTVPRDGVGQVIVDQSIKTNISANAPAVFNFSLGNISQTEEEREYVFAIDPASNPNGAIVKIQGQGPSVPFSIPFGESQDVIVTIERGPVAYTYQDLEFVLYADCEGSDSDDPNFAQRIKVSVEYVEPCSPIDISAPLQNWVLRPVDGPNLNITLNEYDVNDPDLKRILVQYRRAQGDGIWINIAEVLKAQLTNPLFHFVNWNTTGLQDGVYEIRAKTECFNSTNEGISTVITGRIERTPPEVFGTPEPADGVLSLGDEISITFTEPIRCDPIFLRQADLDGNNNIGLYEVATGNLINATITCSGDKIILVPSVANSQLENKFLRVEVDSISDLAGNYFDHAEWTFFVDRSLLDLEGGNLNVTMYEGEEKVELRTLTNVGGSIATFRLSGSPSLPPSPTPEPVASWMTVFPNVGSLLPGEEVLMTFKFDKDLPQGLYSDTIYFNNAQGDERIIVNLRVLCPPPTWDFDEKAYPHTMNLTVKLNIEGTLSSDEEDIVAAFIDGELRGTAKVRHLPTLPPAGTQYMAFLTIYGTDDDQNKPIDLEIWDASACLRYDRVVQNFNFEVDRVWGNLTNPVVLQTNSMIRRDIPLSTGWNWISFNLAFPDPAPTAALASLKYPQNDLIKGQDSYAEYTPSVWVGTLTSLNNASLYQFRADQPDTLQMIGSVIPPASYSIPISTDWNWIGYIPNYPLTVTEALAGLTPLNGDLIKGQTAFAQYLNGFGWLGSLQFMEPAKGYQLKISNPGTLTYPNNLTGGTNDTRRRGPVPAEPLNFWKVDASKFEYNMTLTGMLSASGQNTTLATHEIGAFAGGQLRGSVQAIYVQPFNAYEFFLTAFANSSGELMTFKLYDSATGQIRDLNEKIYFTANQHQGSVGNPIPFTLITTGLQEHQAIDYFEVQPNPFTEEALVTFGLPAAQDVQLSVCDAIGRLVLSQKIAAVSGLNQFRWQAAKQLSAGVYFVRIETEKGVATKKVVKE